MKLSSPPRTPGTQFQLLVVNKTYEGRLEDFPNTYCLSPPKKIFFIVYFQVEQRVKEIRCTLPPKKVKIWGGRGIPLFQGSHAMNCLKSLTGMGYMEALLCCQLGWALRRKSQPGKGHEILSCPVYLLVFTAAWKASLCCSSGP